MISFTFNNLADIPHSFCIEDEAGNEILPCSTVKRGVKGDDIISTVLINPGTYVYFCDVGGHPLLRLSPGWR